MSRILDQKNFRWTPSFDTDVMATFKKHGFKRTTQKERSRRLRLEKPARPNNVRYLPLRKRSAA